MLRIRFLGIAGGDAVHNFQGQFRPLPIQATVEVFQCIFQRISVFGDFFGLVPENIRDGLEHILKPRPAVGIRRWKIGATPEGLAAGIEEHGQRPSALFAEKGEGRLIYLVDIGPFLPVHLDIDKEIIHQRRGLLILEAFVGHHMAPVTGGIADAEQDRLALFLRKRQRFRTPGLPMHRIVLMLEKIGACFRAE